MSHEFLRKSLGVVWVFWFWLCCLFLFPFLVGLGEVGLPHPHPIQVSEIGQTLSLLFVGS